MAKRTTQQMMSTLSVGNVDAIRLFVEAVEVSGLHTAGRDELIAGFRKIIQMGVKALRDTERTEIFAKAVESSLASRSGRRRSTLADLRSYTRRMIRHGDWAEKPLRAITTEECRQMLQAVFGHSPSTYKKARIILNSIFNYGIRQGWCDCNPVRAIETPEIQEKRITPLTNQEIRRLIDTCRCEGMEDMAPAVSLMLWCGIRPGEVQRLQWEDVDPQEKVVYVDGNASKTGGARIVPLRGHARQLSTMVQTNGANGRLTPKNWAKRWKTLREKAGLDTWRPDILRHTFASMHVRRFANLPLLQAEMGHRDSGLLRMRYVNLRGIDLASAVTFWKWGPDS